MKISNRNFLFISLILIVVAINLSLSFLTWEQCRYYFPWLKSIPQKTSFKTRHIVQYGSFAVLVFNFLKVYISSKKHLLASTLSILFIVGSLSEIIQYFIPSRIFTIEDIAFNFIGGVIGLGMYLMALKIYQNPNLSFVKTLFTSLPFKIAIILLCLYGWFYDLVYSTFYNADAYIYFGAAGFDVDWEFIKFIFSKPSSFGIQYRPLGFFGYFWLMKSLFGDAVILHRIFSLLLLALQLFFIIKIVNKISKTTSFLTPLIVITHTLFSFYVLYPIFDLSSTAKYVFTGTLLVFGLWTTLSEKLKNFTWLILLGICTISILCHEGTLTFAYVFLLFAIANDVKLSKKWAVIFAPSLVYIFLRLFVWEKPVQESFMKIGMESFFKKVFFIQTYIWNPAIGQSLYPLGGWTLAFVGLLLMSVILFVIYKYIPKHKKLFVGLLACQLLLLSPFMALQKHSPFDIWLKSQYWAGAITTLIFCLIIMHFYTTNSKKKILFSSLFTFLIVSYFSAINYQFQLKETYLRMQRHINLIIDQIGPLGPEDVNQLIVVTHSDYLEKLNAKPRSEYDRFRFWSYFQRTLPGVLSIYFPKYTFFIDTQNVEGMHPLLIYNESYYYVESAQSTKGYNIHGYRHHLKIPEKLLASTKTIDIHLDREEALPIHGFSFD